MKKFTRECLAACFAALAAASSAQGSQIVMKSNPTLNGIAEVLLDPMLGKCRDDFRTQGNVEEIDVEATLAENAQGQSVGTATYKISGTVYHYLDVMKVPSKAVTMNVSVVKEQDLRDKVTCHVTFSDLE